MCSLTPVSSFWNHALYWCYFYNSMMFDLAKVFLLFISQFSSLLKSCRMCCECLRVCLSDWGCVTLCVWLYLSDYVWFVCMCMNLCIYCCSEFNYIFAIVRILTLIMYNYCMKNELFVELNVIQACMLNLWPFENISVCLLLEIFYELLSLYTTSIKMQDWYAHEYVCV